MKKYDFVILTESRYENPTVITPYISNILLEDSLLQKSLEKKGFIVGRKDWADKDFEWSTTKNIIFRTTWDYFNKFEEFKEWLNEVESKTNSFNPISMIKWNFDKHYLQDLEQKGVRIVESLFIKKGDTKSLAEWAEKIEGDRFILKPTVSGGGKNTFKIEKQDVRGYETIFEKLIQDEDMMIQPFLIKIQEKGEISLIMIDGVHSHSVLKKAKSGDFRVQDDFGGSVEDYSPNESEISFAEHLISVISPTPTYARVDLMWDNSDQLVLSEIELIEPELWMRRNPESADKLAEAIISKL